MKDRSNTIKHHDHVFGQDLKTPGESRALTVVIMTAVMMVIEVAFGMATGSMALLADGLHMASHAVALAITVFAYYYARRHAANERFSFGTGKVNYLGGFTGAVLLAVFAGIMIWESALRFFHPIHIQYDQAIAVAVIGLLVNGISALILQGKHEHASDGHEHARGQSHHDEHHHDHNLKSAYLHVLADALTSVLAIAALLSARYLAWIWMDPLMGVIGAVLILRWSGGLLRTASAVLLDHQGPMAIREKISQAVEGTGDARVLDLHLWVVAPKHYAAILVIASHTPKSAAAYKEAIPKNLGISHLTIEIHPSQT